MISQASPGNLQQVEEFLFSSTRMDSAPVVIAVNYGVSNDQKVYIYKLRVKDKIIKEYIDCGCFFCRYDY